MLGKLIKHEWKNTYKVGCLMLLVVAVVTFFGWLAFQSPMWQALSENEYQESVDMTDVMSILTLMLYVIMLAGVTYGITIYLGVHFYRTMYTDEGYLTHTLPVTKHQLLASKVLVSGFWSMLVQFVVCVSVFVLCGFLLSAILQDYTFSEIWQQVVEHWDEFVEMMETEIGFSLTKWLIMIAISVLISPFCTIIILFGAISIGQLFTKHRVLMAIVTYVGISVLSMFISSVVQSLSSARFLAQMGSNVAVLNDYMDTTMITGTIQNLLMAVILYIVSYLIIDKKLNME